MGRRGRKSTAPGGYGSITAQGYRQILHDGRRRMEHRVVWEENNGPVPDGYRLHHLNGDRLDNRLENLTLVRRGPKSSAPGGYGCVTTQGYLKVFHSGRPWREHRFVWEKANGKIPKGYLVHHINGDRLDNRLENLSLVTPLVHRRIHSGRDCRDGQQWKTCHICWVAKPVDAKNWYLSPEGWLEHGRCRQCYNIQQTVQGKRARRAMQLSKFP